MLKHVIIRHLPVLLLKYDNPTNLPSKVMYSRLVEKYQYLGQ